MQSAPSRGSLRGQEEGPCLQSLGMDQSSGVEGNPQSKRASWGYVSWGKIAYYAGAKGSCRKVLNYWGLWAL